MNYFAHGRPFLHEPYFVAGTAVPDWLNVVDRRCRARSRAARQLVGGPDAVECAVARGIIRHHTDDAWFHQTRAFAELSLALTVQIRDRLPPDAGFRPSFLGHILVELLLDAALIEQHPEQLDTYYAAIASLDAARVACAVARIATRPPHGLDGWIARFLAERFLYDYLEDDKLLWRLNRVLRRVRLAPLPRDFSDLLPAARQQVRDRQTELLGGPPPGDAPPRVIPVDNNQEQPT